MCCGHAVGSMMAHKGRTGPPPHHHHCHHFYHHYGAHDTPNNVASHIFFKSENSNNDFNFFIYHIKDRALQWTLWFLSPHFLKMFLLALLFLW